MKNPPAIQETRAQPLSWEDLLEEKMATHSSILAERIPWTEKPGELQSMGSQRVGLRLKNNKPQESSPGSPRWLPPAETLDAKDDIWGEKRGQSQLRVWLRSL